MSYFHVPTGKYAQPPVINSEELDTPTSQCDMIRISETHEHRLKQAYNAGYDFATGKRDESNSHSKHFETIELGDAWQKGYEDGEFNRKELV